MGDLSAAIQESCADLLMRSQAESQDRDNELTSCSVPHVLVLLDGALHVLPFVGWHQAEALIKDAGGSTAFLSPS